MSNYYVYRHKKPTGEVFYIGMGSGRRHLQISGRSSFWTNIYKRYGRVSEVVVDNLTKDRANLVEKCLIKFYGRRDIKTGVLVNMSEGGGDVWNRGKVGTRNGMKNTQYQKDVVSKYMKDNNPMKREDIKRKSSESHMGKKWNQSMFDTITVTKDGEYIGTYYGPRDVSEKLGLVYSSVVSVLHGKRNSLFGYKIKSNALSQK